MNTKQQPLATFFDPATPQPEGTDRTIRRLLPQERVLGLSAGCIYHITNADTEHDSDDPGKLVFVRDVDTLDTWNTGTPPNTADDLFITLHVTDVLGVTDMLQLESAGNVYDPNHPNVAVMRMNAALLERTDRIEELYDTIEWTAQPPHMVTPLHAVDAVSSLLKYTPRTALTP